jgi:class 3 adenylate cyclase
LENNFHGPILISDATYQQIKDDFDTEFVDAVIVKGRTELVRIYKVLGNKAAPDEERVQALEI